MVRLFMLLGPLLLAGCALIQTGKPLRDAKLSPEAVVINVPVVLQDDQFDCGVSALSMVLAYYGKPCHKQKAAELKQKAAREQGLTGGDLQDYMQAEGLETLLFKGTIGSSITGLYYHLDRGRPLVVALSVTEDSNHFVLVTGYDPVNDWILLQDPQRGALVSFCGQFEHAWAQAEHFTLLATPGE